MPTFDTYVEEDYTGDVEIDFSTLTVEQRYKILKAIVKGDKYTFEDVDLFFSGDIEVEYDPEPWY